jgi:hypothetical protein
MPHGRHSVFAHKRKAQHPNLQLAAVRKSLDSGLDLRSTQPAVDLE